MTVFPGKNLALMAIGILACATTAIIIVTPAEVSAQEVSAEEAVAYGTWGAANEAKDIPKAVTAAEAYLKAFPSGGYAEYLKKWLGQAQLSVLDEAIKAKDMDLMIATGRPMVARDPENVNVLYALASNLRQRELLASPAKFDHAQDAKEFAQKAIALVEGGKTLTGVPSFDKDATLAWLYQSLALIEAKGGNPKEAIKLYEKSSALSPDDVTIKGRNLLNTITILQSSYAAAATAFNALPEADRTAAEPSDALKAAREALHGAADAVIDAAATFVAFGKAKNLPAATVDRMSQLLETAYKGRYPEDAGLEGLKKILADKGAPAGA
jgi:tetratricopeptide (TPR) repeat protein